eukprot:360794-Chlamydomonas_euryale.AAC.17
MTKGSAGGRGKSGKKAVSRSNKAGLQFPVGRIARCGTVEPAAATIACPATRCVLTLVDFWCAPERTVLSALSMRLSRRVVSAVTMAMQVSQERQVR